ncbi:hypothetical protein MKEN_00013000 [Mycena kentingensis (nom. inval.)]|nr:hypothetical protein MKEN_00013000 [Mycena kentingensis (nom. inval.)]
MAPAPSSIDFVSATFVALFVEAVLYGIFALLFALSMSVLLRKNKRRTSGTIPLVVASVVMFLLGTLHLGTDLRRLMDGLLLGKDISAVNSPTYILKSAVYATQTLVGDIFMLYRVGLERRQTRLHSPAALSARRYRMYSFTITSSDVNPIFLESLHHWIVSFLSMTLITNFSCTMLIAARIWWVSRDITTGHTRIAGSRLGPAIMIFVESGVIYSFALVLLLALYVNGSYAQYVLLDAEVQIVGVVFSMIIVRVGLGLGSEDASRIGTSTINRTRTFPQFKTPAGAGRGQTTTFSSGALELAAREPQVSPGITVDVTTTRKVDGGGYDADGDEYGGRVYYTKTGDMWA